MSSCCQNKCDSRATKARCVHHHQHLDFRGPADNERVPGENLADLETSSLALFSTSGLSSGSIDSVISGDVLSMLGASGQALFSKLTIKGKRGFLGWPAKLKARSFLQHLCCSCL